MADKKPALGKGLSALIPAGTTTIEPPRGLVEVDIDRLEANAFQPRTLLGMGAGLETALPWRTLLALEWGYGLQGRDRDGRQGTQTLRLTAYRVF